MATNSAKAAARLKLFEGVVPYMYRCTGGEVTIGVGHAIPAAADAGKLSWSVGGSRATLERAQSDFAKVVAAPKGLVAGCYESLTQCRMSANDIEALLAADIRLFEAKLNAALPRWPSYPAPAQEALFDMGYNLGVGGLLKFRQLLAAVDAGQWTTAAAECHRRGIGDVRNRETANLFLQAAGA
jgi:GH24 family phage-related lysozyme (muramidase)